MLFVEFVASGGSTRAVKTPAVLHPGPNIRACGSRNAWISHVEDVVIRQSTFLHIALSEHIHQVLVVNEGEIGQAAFGHGDVAERLPEIAGKAVEQGDARGTSATWGDDMLGPGELARHGGDAVVRAAQIAPIILRAGGSRAVSPVEEMLCALAEGGGALEPQVRFIAGRNPGDNRQLATATTAKNGGLKAD